MYALIQFAESDGGTVSIVNKSWLTPRKCEVHWPPVKGSKEFDKYLQNSPDQRWKIYGVQKVFYETDNLEKAKQKLKLAEVSSDLQSEEESEKEKNKRNIKRTKRYISTSDDDEQIDQNVCPPPLKKQHLNALNRNFSTLTPQGTALNGNNSTLTPQGTALNGNNSTLTPQGTALNGNNSTLTPQGTALNGNNSTLTPQQGVSKTNNKVNLSDLSPDESFSSTLLESVARELLNEPSENIKLTAFQDKVISLLSVIKVQNEQILSILTPKQKQINLNPCFKFPLKCIEDLETTEALLGSKENFQNLVSYLMTIGGRITSNKVYRVMNTILDDCLAKEFNYYGKRSQKKPFCELKLRMCVIDAMKNTTTEKENEIEQLIKNWLKHAPSRIQKKEMRKNNNVNSSA